NNSSGDGGAVFNGRDSIALIRNSIITTNRANGRGAGIYNDHMATMTIVTSTVAHNICRRTGLGGTGGGIDNAGTLTVLASTTANTDATETFGTRTPEIRSTFIAGSANCIGSGDGLVGIADGANGNRVGTIAAPLDPKLGPLENNVGRTLTRLPRPGSPLINS